MGYQQNDDSVSKCGRMCLKGCSGTDWSIGGVAHYPRGDTKLPAGHDTNRIDDIRPGQRVLRSLACACKASPQRRTDGVYLNTVRQTPALLPSRFQSCKSTAPELMIAR